MFFDCYKSTFIFLFDQDIDAKQLQYVLIIMFCKNLAGSLYFFLFSNHFFVVSLQTKVELE